MTTERPAPNPARAPWRAVRNLIGEPSVVMFRQAAARRGFAPHLRQFVDLEMWFHLLLQGEFVYTSEPLCAFRQHAAQQTVVNQNVADVEIVALLQTYLPAMPGNAATGLGRWERQQLFFRCLGDVLKHGSSDAAFTRAAAWLQRQHRFPATGICWFRHRFRRAVAKITRPLRKPLRRRTPPTEASPQVPFLRAMADAAHARLHPR